MLYIAGLFSGMKRSVLLHRGRELLNHSWRGKLNVPTLVSSPASN